MSNVIKFLHSGMLGAPAWGNAADTGIATLDACLVNGFNPQTATGVTVSAGVATMTFAGTHGFAVDSVMLVAGATPAGLNGERRVLSAATTTTLTFAAPGVPDGAATGTITARYAPLGWSKPFSGTNAAAYRSTDVTGTQMWLRVQDLAGTFSVRTRGFESMTSASDGAGPFPLAQESFWPKGSSSAAAPWLIVGDSKTFYLLRQHLSGTTFVSGMVAGFGDFVSFSANDAWRCFLSGYTLDIGVTSNSIGAGGSEGSLELSHATAAAIGISAPRSRNGVPGAVSFTKTMEAYMATNAVVVSGGTTNPGGPAFATYPSPANQGLILSRVVLAEGGGPRGYLRGLFHTPQNCHASFGQMERINGQGVFAGRRLMALKCGAAAGAVSQGVVFVDITGPWEN